MINYSVDSKVRYWHWSTLMAISFAISYIFVLILRNFHISPSGDNLLEYLYAVSAPSVLAVFTLVSYVHDHFLWKLLPRGLTIPNFGGEWIGYIVERHEPKGKEGEVVINNETMKPVRLTIQQRFNKIDIRFNSIKHSMADQSRPTTANLVGIIETESKNPKIVFTWSRRSLDGRSEFTMSKDGKQLHLAGEYFSDFPRSGQVTLRKVSKFESQYCGQVRRRNSRSNRPFLAIEVDESFLRRQISEMKGLTNERFTELSASRYERDKSSYYVTIVNPEEFVESQCNNLVGQSRWLQIGQLGMVSNGTGTSYYAICNSKEIQDLRRSATLESSELHIALGFYPDDVHDCSKGEHTRVEGQLMRLIRKAK